MSTSTLRDTIAANSSAAIAKPPCSPSRSSRASTCCSSARRARASRTSAARRRRDRWRALLRAAALADDRARSDLGAGLDLRAPAGSVRARHRRLRRRRARALPRRGRPRIPAILDTMLHLLGPERQALVGTKQVKSPLVSAIGSANTWPEDAAMLDRWLLRASVRVPAGLAAARSCSRSRRPRSRRRSRSPISTRRTRRREAMTWVGAAFDTLDAILGDLDEAGIASRDRRLRASDKIARAAALLRGGTDVEPIDLEPLQWVLWSVPDQAATAAQKVVRARTRRREARRDARRSRRDQRARRSTGRRGSTPRRSSTALVKEAKQGRERARARTGARRRSSSTSARTHAGAGRDPRAVGREDRRRCGSMSSELHELLGDGAEAAALAVEGRTWADRRGIAHGAQVRSMDEARGRAARRAVGRSSASRRSTPKDWPLVGRRARDALSRVAARLAERPQADASARAGGSS
jgi:hypothetical protein